MDSLSPNTILTAQTLIIDEKSILPKAGSFYFQKQKENQTAPIILFRKQEGDTWITIQREPSGEVKGLIDQLNGNSLCLPIKGIPAFLTVKRVQKFKNTLNGSRLILNNFFIEIIPNLKSRGA